MDTLSESKEVEWTLRGIKLAIGHVKDIRREQLSNERLRRPRISRWLARDLFHAVTISLGYLHRADKKRAIDTLEKIKKEAEENTP